ncbi:LysE family translocator [Clostridium ljungdahlii]|uniref:Threonine efflux system n=1 Tax=Clostridium ljungdahlii TaxID=1538 RepID=A0A162J5L3_9CLOT|nr:LysE family transporter [Clostridium ljungdahlii]OAA90635.1 threonine efflux system [Clostridium ljungdahlii]
MLLSLFKGILIGLITGMPLGPIGAMCLRNTITFGRKCGLISGLGSALTDTIYATIAALGFMLIEKFILIHKLYFHIIGGLILICFGVYSFIKKSPGKDIDKTGNIKSYSPSGSMFKAFISTFFIALANPATIFSFIAVFTGLRLAHIGQEPDHKLLLIIGVFIGSMLWWILLVFTMSKFNNKLNVKNVKFIDKILSSIIIFSGVIIILGGFKYFGPMKPNFILHSKIFKIFLNIKYNMSIHQ